MFVSFFFTAVGRKSIAKKKQKGKSSCYEYLHVLQIPRQAWLLILASSVNYFGLVAFFIKPKR